MFHAALRDDPKYVKALQRRAASNATIDSWTSLSAAVEGTVSWYIAWPSFDLLLDRLYHATGASSLFFPYVQGDRTISGITEAPR
jgi:hypothetical protein